VSDSAAAPPRGRRPLAIALLASAVCLVSQLIVTSPLVGSGWDALGRAVWLTILVTIPAFVVACVFGVIALAGWIRGRR
jgi:hypothetical protein